MKGNSDTILFGEAERSDLWAVSTSSPESVAHSFRLRADQVIFALVNSGKMEFESTKGRGREKQVTETVSGQQCVFGTGSEPCHLSFESGAEVILIGLRRSLLADMLREFRPGLSDSMRSVVFSQQTTEKVISSLPSSSLDRLVASFLSPSVSGPARSFWYESQIKELIALLCFTQQESGTEFFCSRQKRLTIDRVAKAKAHLKANFDEPLDLQSLSEEIGCSPFYLSRTFSAETGMTISQYLRKIRIQTAAELIATGQCNVSEAAVEVGYQSMSHFSKAFHLEKGCLPSKYDAA